MSIPLGVGGCEVNGDRHNAFNLQPRGPTFEATKEVAPLLARFYRSFYGGKETRVYNSRGEFIGLNATGVRQGDPAGGVFFCVGDHSVLTELNRRVCEISAARGCTLPALAYGYADDNTIAVSDKIAVEVADAYVEIVSRHGGRVNKAKSSILVRPGRSNRAIASPFKVLEDGVRLLGNPVGTVEFRREFLRKEISAMSESIPTLTSSISPQSAFILLHLCYNARPAYLARVAEPDLYWEFMGEFDKRVDEGIANIALMPVNPFLQVMRSLRRHMGGLGLSRHQGPRSEMGCIDARMNTLAFIRSYAPEFESGTSITWTYEEVGRRATVIDSAEYMQEPARDEDEAELEELRARPGLTIRQQERRRWNALHRQLQSTQKDEQFAAWMMSLKSMGTGDWLPWRGGSFSLFRFTPAEFRENLRLRLLTEIFPSVKDGTRCPRCPNIRLDLAPYHCLLCSQSQKFRDYRHDSLRDMTDDLVGNVWPHCTIEVEKELTCADGSKAFADVYISKPGGEIIILEAGITNPAALQFLERCRLNNGKKWGSSIDTPDVAARMTEAKRVREFNARGINLRSTARFVPFIFEATGRPGPSARAFLEELGDRAAVSFFLAKMSASIARFNARIILAARSTMAHHDNELASQRRSFRSGGRRLLRKPSPHNRPSPPTHAEADGVDGHDCRDTQFLHPGGTNQAPR